MICEYADIRPCTANQIDHDQSIEETMRMIGRDDQRT
jgi:hypothetical protein